MGGYSPPTYVSGLWLDLFRVYEPGNIMLFVLFPIDRRYNGSTKATQNDALGLDELCSVLELSQLRKGKSSQ